MSTNPFIILTDRSRTISYQECPTRRYLAYHFDGIGITANKLIIPLVVGTWTHHGLALLLAGQDIEIAVAEAVKEYWKEVRKRGIQVEPGEDDAYVADEQCALVEGMLRAYHKFRLPTLLAEYDVIETEREEDWKMAEWEEFRPGPDTEDGAPDGRMVLMELHWMARADALLREKVSGDLYVLSFKTAASWDSRRQREAEHDMQGLSELAAVEYRLHALWNGLHLLDEKAEEFAAFHDLGSPELLKLIKEMSAPPRIAGVKMEYLLKGDRYAEKSEGGRKVQRSPLVRGYQRMNAPVLNDPGDLGWKRNWQDEDGKERRLDYRTWKAFEVWKQPGGVKAWVELLAETAIQPEAGNCLETLFVTPVPYFRNEDDLRDWYESTVHQEKRVAEGIAEVKAAVEQYGWASMQVRSLMNRNFPKHRRSCDWPSPCQFIGLCYGSNVAENPVESGMYMPRVPHHAMELELKEIANG